MDRIGVYSGGGVVLFVAVAGGRAQNVFARFSTTLIVAVLVADGAQLTLGHTQDAPARAASQPTPEEMLWRDLQRLRAAPMPKRFSAEAYDELVRGKQTLLDKVRSYLSLYPGGRHRDRAAEIELTTLFEIGTLRRGDYADLRARVAEFLQHPPSPAAAHAAAYWALKCGSAWSRESAETKKPAGRPRDSRRPSSLAPRDATQDHLFEAYARYVQKYPDSRFAVRLQQLRFERAARRKDTETMRRIGDHLRGHFPEHPAAAAVLAHVRRLDAIGRPFWLNCTDLDDRSIDTRLKIGRPVSIVVWSSATHASRTLVRKVDAQHKSDNSFYVVGVNLDESVEQCRQACRTLDIRWPQFNDRLGPANRFAREWGVTAAPVVFVVDRKGRLLGWAGEAEPWLRLLQEALKN